MRKMTKRDLYLFLTLLLIFFLICLAALPRPKKDIEPKGVRTFENADSLMKAKEITKKDLEIWKE